MADGYAPWGQRELSWRNVWGKTLTKEENYFGETAENQNSFESL